MLQPHTHSLQVIEPPLFLNEQTKDAFYRTIQAVAATETEMILVNLEQVVSVDSTGLGILYGAYRLALQQGQKLILYRPQGQVWQSFQLTGLDRIVTISATLRAIIKEMSPIAQRSQKLDLPTFSVQN